MESLHAADQRYAAGRTILLIARNYPPQVGGLESYARDLYRSLQRVVPVEIMANTRGRMFLPLFYLYCPVAVYLKRKRIGHIHLTDGVLAPLGWFLKRVLGFRVSITVHGLDVIYRNPLFQALVPRSINALDHVIGVSRYSIAACVDRGIDAGRCTVIPNGIDFQNLPSPAQAGNPAIESWLAAGVKGRKILLSVGRLIERKGVAWFVEQVFPLLPAEYIYIIAGEGPEQARIRDCITRLCLAGRVYLPGLISDAHKAQLYKTADLFIMPNISRPGDAEGFGISIIEAAAHGLPAIATGIEGIRDAVDDGITGSLVKERDVEGFRQAIQQAAFDRRDVRDRTRQRFDWDLLADHYLQVFTRPGD